VAVNGQDIINYAQQFLGTPYVWGGNSLSSGVDCSGLVQQVYKHFGLSVARTTYDQMGQGVAVGMKDLKAGDMVFFDTDKSTSGPDHVGIYIGNGKFIEAPKPGEGVKISDMKSGYYQDIFMGGRRISGIQGGGPNNDQDNPDSEVVQRLSPEEMASEYGFAYSFLNSIPEVKRLFTEYVNEDWSKERFQAELRNTKWWQENSDSMRKTQAMKSTDPATYEANLQATTVLVQQEAAKIGASIPPKKLKSIAEKALATNMDEAALANVLGGYVKFVGGTLKGEAGQYENSIKSYAATQGVTMDDQSVKNQAALIARKLATESDFKNQIMQQAASAYPGYKQQLEGGQTMMDIANPYIQIMAEQLEVNPATIKLTDPLIRQALNGVGQDGKPTGMDQTDFMNRVRSDPRWSQTSGAQNDVMNVGLNVLKSMGLR
jgi:NlpC/P60 family